MKLRARFFKTMSVALVAGVLAPVMCVASASSLVRPDSLRLGVPFVENLGQADPVIRFQTALRGGAFGVTGDGRMLYRLGNATFVERFDDGTATPRGASPGPTRISR